MEALLQSGTAFGYEAGVDDLYWSRKNKELADNNFELTNREMEVLTHIAEGLSNVEISELLTISAHTVKGHVINIFNKFGVGNRTRVAVMAVRNNIV